MSKILCLVGTVALTVGLLTVHGFATEGTGSMTPITLAPVMPIDMGASTTAVLTVVGSILASGAVIVLAWRYGRKMIGWLSHG